MQTAVVGATAAGDCFLISGVGKILTFLLPSPLRVPALLELSNTFPCLPKSLRVKTLHNMPPPMLYMSAYIYMALGH